MAESGTLDDALAAAVADRQAGRYGDAAARFDAILAQAPDWLLALVRYAELCEQQGDLARAHELWERAAARAPNNAGVQTNLAKLRRQQGEPDGAIAAASAALAAQPGQAAARFNRALAARDAGHYGDAAADLDRLLADHPGQAAFLAERGRLALALDDPAGARDWLEKAREAGAGDLDSALNLATALNRLGQPEAALAELDAVAEPGRAHAAWHLQRGYALAALDEASAAESALAEAVARGTRQVEAYLALASHQLARKAGGAAEATLNAGLAVTRDWAAPDAAQRQLIAGLWQHLATLYQDRGDYERVLACDRTALAWAPELRGIERSYLLHLHYDPAETPESLYRAIRSWRDRHCGEADATSAYPPAGACDKAPLRLGVLAGKLRTSPQTLLYLRAFENLDPDRFTIVVYDLTTGSGDALTERFRAAVAAWHNVAGRSDAQLVEQMRADGIDILINKMGHGEGRVELCAHKPAPVIVQWGGFGTTGLDSVQWFLGDWTECPPGCESSYSEAVYRLPDDYVVYMPPGPEPEPGPLPCRSAGHVTFGCFNNPLKINPELAALWARVLAAVPGSRLLLKRSSFADPDSVAAVRARLEDAGIPGERLALRDAPSRDDLVRSYGEVDIALDTWPYSGGLTTLEALWMGVPVVSLPGHGFVGRHAASHLVNTGNGDWVVADRASYVEKAASWACAPDALAQLRQELRARVYRSPVCDAPRFGRNLGAALQDMWRRSVAGEAEGA